MIVYTVAWASLGASSARADSSNAGLAEALGAVRARAATLSARFGRPLDPLHFRDPMALRFIQRSAWSKALAAGQVDPRFVYGPAPQTWDQWDFVTETLVEPAAAAGTALDLATVLLWNRDAIQGTVQDWVKAGELKTTPNYGRDTEHATAVSLPEITEMLSLHFPGETAPALGWIYLTCTEELPPALTLPTTNPECETIYADARKNGPSGDLFWRQTLADMEAGKLADHWYWYACWPRSPTPGPATTDAATRFCGMIIYPPPSTARARLERILTDVNAYFTQPPGAREDVLRFATRMQRAAVALHPFNKGNGRGSRWLMDYITLRAGLPPILVENMDLDITTPYETYARQARDGSWESIFRMQKCLDAYERDGFDAVQKTPCGLAAPDRPGL